MLASLKAASCHTRCTSTAIRRQQPYTHLSSDASAGPVLVTASGLRWGPRLHLGKSQGVLFLLWCSSQFCSRHDLLLLPCCRS